MIIKIFSENSLISKNIRTNIIVYIGKYQTRTTPNRQNIVMTKSPTNREGVIEVLDAASAIKEAKKTSNKISIIGGESIYKEFLPLANKLLITEINITVEGADTFFPAWEKQEWAENSRINSIENGIEYSFVEYLRD